MTSRSYRMANPGYANIDSARRETRIAESGNIFLIDSTEQRFRDYYNENNEFAYYIQDLRIARSFRPAS